MPECKVCAREVASIAIHAPIAHSREDILMCFTDDEIQEYFSSIERERTEKDLKGEEFGYQ